MSALTELPHRPLERETTDDRKRHGVARREGTDHMPADSRDHGCAETPGAIITVPADLCARHAASSDRIRARHNPSASDIIQGDPRAGGVLVEAQWPTVVVGSTTAATTSAPAGTAFCSRVNLYCGVSDEPS